MQPQCPHLMEGVCCFELTIQGPTCIHRESHSEILRVLFLSSLSDLCLVSRLSNALWWPSTWMLWFSSEKNTVLCRFVCLPGTEETSRFLQNTPCESRWFVLTASSLVKATYRHCPTCPWLHVLTACWGEVYWPQRTDSEDNKATHWERVPTTTEVVFSNGPALTPCRTPTLHCVIWTDFSGQSSTFWLLAKQTLYVNFIQCETMLIHDNIELLCKLGNQS